MKEITSTSGFLIQSAFKHAVKYPANDSSAQATIRFSTQVPSFVSPTELSSLLQKEKVNLDASGLRGTLRRVRILRSDPRSRPLPAALTPREVAVADRAVAVGAVRMADLVHGHARADRRRARARQRRRAHLRPLGAPSCPALARCWRRPDGARPRIAQGMVHADDHMNGHRS